MSASASDRTPAQSGGSSSRRRRAPLGFPPAVDGARGPVATLLQWGLLVAALGIMLIRLPSTTAPMEGILVELLVIAGVGIAIILVPWSRLPAWTAITVPLIDVGAITPDRGLYHRRPGK